MSNYPPGHPTGYYPQEETYKCPICKTEWNVLGMYDAAVNSWDADREEELDCVNAARLDHRLRYALDSMIHWVNRKIFEGRFTQQVYAWSDTHGRPNMIPYNLSLSSEPEEEVWDPGDEVDDEGGMSEHRWEGYDERD